MKVEEGEVLLKRGRKRGFSESRTPALSTLAASQRKPIDLFWPWHAAVSRSGLGLRGALILTSFTAVANPRVQIKILLCPSPSTSNLAISFFCSSTSNLTLHDSHPYQPSAPSDSISEPKFQPHFSLPKSIKMTGGKSGGKASGAKSNAQSYVLTCWRIFPI